MVFLLGLCAFAARGRLVDYMSDHLTYQESVTDLPA